MQMSSRCNRLSQQQQCLRFLLMGKRVNVMHSRKNPSKSSTLGKTSTQTYRFLGKCITACLLRPVWRMTHLITGVFCLLLSRTVSVFFALLLLQRANPHVPLTLCSTLRVSWHTPLHLDLSVGLHLQSAESELSIFLCFSIQHHR